MTDDHHNPAELERSAVQACLEGRVDEGVEHWTRAHEELLRGGEVERAVRCGFWLALQLLGRGDAARASGWLARANRLLQDRPDSVERGFLLYPVGVQRIFGGDDAGALATFREATAIAERFRDADLCALARHGQGRALVRLGRTAEGFALLDEVMAAVEAGETSPLVAGDVYCSLIEACHEVYDMRRAQEWTAALSRWCERLPDTLPYRGHCLLRRADLLRLAGQWPGALDEIEQARERLLRPPPERAAGAAFQQRADLRRLQGDFAGAEDDYREASRWGRQVEPGLSLLRLARGDVQGARAAIRLALDAAAAVRVRMQLLPAAVEIMLAAGDVAAARSAAEELGDIAARLGARLLQAGADMARGAVLLAEGDPRAALGLLRRARDAWDELRVPYESARTRALVAQACRSLGDETTAALETDAAERAFAQLGARPDLAAIEAPRQDGPALSPRELEVLRLVTTGRTNRTIGAELGISEKTVDRHVSNIFTKLGVSSRAAATAAAYERRLVGSSSRS